MCRWSPASEARPHACGSVCRGIMWVFVFRQAPQRGAQSARCVRAQRPSRVEAREALGAGAGRCGAPRHTFRTSGGPCALMTAARMMLVVGFVCPLRARAGEGGGGGRALGTRRALPRQRAPPESSSGCGLRAADRDRAASGVSAVHSVLMSTYAALLKLWLDPVTGFRAVYKFCPFEWRVHFDNNFELKYMLKDTHKPRSLP